jgi:hypothetical protein
MNKHTEPCTLPKVSPDKYYCRVHSRYEGKYSPEDIPFLHKCITCSYLTKPNEITKQCESCFQKNPIRNCKWKNRDGKHCSRHSLQLKQCCRVHQPYENLTFDECFHCGSCGNWFEKTKYEVCPKCCPESRRCKAIRKDKSQCTNLQKNGCIYCGKHSHYENVILPEEFETLPVCLGCRQTYRPDGTSYRLCSKCINREKSDSSVDSSHLTVCKAISHTSGKHCNNYAKPGTEYCGLHNNYAKHKELVESGIQVCLNWIRGCWNETTLEFKQCESCREKDRKIDSERRNSRREINQLNEDTDASDSRVCVRCGKSQSHIEFIHFADEQWGDAISNPRITEECRECRMKASQRDTRIRSDRIYYPKRNISVERFDIENVIRKKYYHYKHLDIRNRLISPTESFESILPKSFAYSIMRQPCSYCNTPTNEMNVNGLDRLDNTKGHCFGNVVSCCETCNISKNNHSLKTFFQNVQKQAKETKYRLSPSGFWESPF